MERSGLQLAGSDRGGSNSLANRALLGLVAAGGAIFAREVDDLQMASVPLTSWKELL